MAGVAVTGGCAGRSGWRPVAVPRAALAPEGRKGEQSYDAPMTELSEEARSRLADVVALQPTKNGELQERWGMDSGSEVHRFLEAELKPYYYRDDDSLIRATAEAADLVDVKPGVESDEETGGPRVVRVPALQRAILDVLGGPDDEPESVVAVLHAVRDAGHDAAVDEVRSGLRSLANKGVVTTVRRTVPTYRLAVSRADLTVEPLDEPAEPGGDGDDEDGDPPREEIESA